MLAKTCAEKMEKPLKKKRKIIIERSLHSTEKKTIMRILNIGSILVILEVSGGE